MLVIFSDTGISKVDNSNQMRLCSGAQNGSSKAADTLSDPRRFDLRALGLPIRWRKMHHCRGDGTDRVFPVWSWFALLPSFSIESDVCHSKALIR
jgi:hypothetical protein